jgi:hypothetical protein
MFRIYYAGSAFVTTEAIAIEFLDYAVDLAKRGTAIAVELPIVSDGRVHAVNFVIGPASQVVAEPAPEIADIDMSEALEQLRNEREADKRRRSFAVYDEGSGSFIDDL